MIGDDFPAINSAMLALRYPGTRVVARPAEPAPSTTPADLETTASGSAVCQAGGIDGPFCTADELLWSVVRI